ncbi:unnamed protein product [Paramecium octaurelia]|uniref:Uncharacterized protein n=1 Tax=Paramecium octaurelia TaxID=43137 RepID=A0A8S1SRH2_PAROT|nr:unnamed protein product [Paramecium octaurelia]
MLNTGNTNSHNNNSNDQYIALNPQSYDQQKKIILFEFDSGKLDNTLIILVSFLQQLSNIKTIPINVLQKCKGQLDKIYKLIQEVELKINSLQHNFSQEQTIISKENYDTEYTKQRKQMFHQQPQNEGDSSVISNLASSILINSEADLKKIQQQNVVDAKPNQSYIPQGCIINFSYAKNNQSDYQFMLYLLMEQNLKVNKLSLSCLGNVKIKRSDLTTLSNKNKFDLLLNQQLEHIFSNIKRKAFNNEFKVLSCSNTFCSFKCFENVQVNNTNKNHVFSYCPLCEEQSVV